MTAPAAGTTVVQNLVQQLTAPLNEAATAFATTIAEALAKDVEQITKSFKAAHPAIAQVTDGITGFAGAVAESTGSVAAMSGNTVEMIRNTRQLRQEISAMTLENVKATVTTLRTAVAARLSAVATAITTAATRAWAVAQRALNLVIALNPIGLIITAITLLVAAIVLAYQRSTTFRNIVNAAFRAVRDTALTVFNAIRNAVAVVWPYVSRIIQIAVAVIRTYVTTYFTVVRVVITTVFNAVRAVATVAWRAIAATVTTYVRIVRTVVTAVFTAIRGVVTTIWSGIRTVIRDAVSAVVRTIQGIRQIVAVVRNAFNQAKDAVGTAIGAVVTFVKGLPGRVVSVLGGIGRTLYGAGRDLISGFVNGIRQSADRVLSAIKESILDKIPGPITNFLGISSPSRLMADIGGNVGAGLAVGIDRSRDQVEQAIRRLVPVPRTAAIRPALAGLAQTTLTAGVLWPGLAARPTAPVTVNVYPQPGQSEYEIGRIAARELAWAAKH